MDVSADVIGYTKVQGFDYLTDGLAHSLLKRQIEKHRHGGSAKFLTDRIHCTRSGPNGVEENGDIYYNTVRKVYTFYNEPNMLMLVTDGDYDLGRIYHGFRFRDSNDVQRVKRHIRGDRSSVRRRRSISQSYSQAPVVYEQPAYRVYQPSSPTVYMERVETVPTVQRVEAVPVVERVETVPVVERIERTPAVERVQRRPSFVRERSPSPTYVKTITVPPPQPITTYVRPSEVYVSEPQPIEPLIYKSIQREIPVKPTYVERVETVPVIEHVETASVVERVPKSMPTIIRERSPSPVYIKTLQPVKTAVSTYNPPAEVYVPQPAQETVVLRRSKPTYVERTEIVPTVYTQPNPSPVVVRRASVMSRPTSGVLYDIDDDDSSMILKRVSRVPPT